MIIMSVGARLEKIAIIIHIHDMDNYKGQHLVIKRIAGSYTHHGLGIGNDRVIHYSGLAGDLSLQGTIEEVSLDAFSQGEPIILKQHDPRKFSIEDAILRARLRLGENQYHVLHNNCEHFVEWCITGIHRSHQSRRGKVLYSLGVGTRLVMGSKNPAGFLVGAAAGYAYIQHKGKKKTPDFDALEAKFERLKSNAVILLPKEMTLEPSST